MVMGSVRAWGECVVGGVRGGVACVPPTIRDVVRQCTAGTHPTGMHSFKQF